MSTEPFQVSYDWLNQFVLMMGYGDTSTPLTNQVRMFYESGRFRLKVWNGTSWVDAQPNFALSLISSLTSGAAINFDGGHSFITIHENGDFSIKSGVNELHKIVANNGGAQIEMSHDGILSLITSSALLNATFTDDLYFQLNKGIGIFTKTPKLEHLGKDRTLVNNEIQSLEILNNCVGFIKIRNLTYTGSKNGVIFSVGGRLDSNGGVSIVGSYSNLYWSFTKGTANMINVYSDTDNIIKIENKTGVTVQLRIFIDVVN